LPGPARARGLSVRTLMMSRKSPGPVLVDAGQAASRGQQPVRRALELFLPAMRRHRLAAVLVGSAAAMLRGEPVSPRDLDFLWRDTPVQRRRLLLVAQELGAKLTRPYYHL